MKKTARLVAGSLIFAQSFFMPLYVYGQQKAAVDDIKPRSFVPHSMMEVKENKDGSTEITVDSQAQIQRLAAIKHKQFLRNHHVGSFKQTGDSWTLVDQTSKKTWIYKVNKNGGVSNSMKGHIALAELFPKNKNVLSAASNFSERAQNWPQALDFYRRAYVDFKGEPDIEDVVDPDADFHDQARIISDCAYFELMMGHYSTAIKDLSKAIELKPDLAFNYKNRAEAYKKLHKLDLAEKDQKKYTELKSGSRADFERHGRGRPGFASALFFANFGLFEQAVLVADKILKTDPKSGDALLARARANYGMGKFSEAAADYKKLLAQTKNSPLVQALVQRSEKFAKEGPPPYGDTSVLKEEVRESNERLAQFHSDNGDGGGHGGRGRHNMPGMERLSVDKLAQSHKGDLRVFLAICSGLQKKDQYKALEAEANKLLLLNPQSNSGLIFKIDACQNQRNWAETEKLCTTYLDLVSNNKVDRVQPDYIAYVYGLRGLARRAQKNIAGALADDNNSLKIAPENSLVLNDRSDCYALSGKAALAKQDRDAAAKARASAPEPESKNEVPD